MSARAAFANLLWLASSVPAHRRFRASLTRAREEQAAILSRYLRENADTAFGREHRFDRIASVEDYRARVPARDYDDFRPWVDRIAAGEPGVLTRSPVRLFEPTGGSTGGSKWVPYTPALQRELGRAVATWISDLAGSRPALLAGPAYWSITPPARPEGGRPTRVPVGFEEDSAYLGGWRRAIVNATLAVPGGVRHLADLGEFRRATLLHLLRARDLRLVSVWHPTFLSLLADTLRDEWSVLVDALARGTAPRGRVPGLAPDPARAREIARLGPDPPGRLWPRLAVISCWADAAAAPYAAALGRLFPGVEIQPKGLIATEGIVSIPYRGRHPLAVTSHFFEFEAPGGRVLAAPEVERGAAYSVIVTTGGGLYRYRLHDRVEVTAFLGTTPCLRFLGKEDRISDQRGEKLDEAFVAGVLARVLAERSVAAELALLAPETGPRGTRYVLFLSAPGPADPGLAAALEGALRHDVQYAYAVDLGQLMPADVCRVGPEAPRRYLERMHALGGRLGAVKPAALSPRDDWRAVFCGPLEPGTAAPGTTAAGPEGAGI